MSSRKSDKCYTITRAVNELCASHPELFEGWTGYERPSTIKDVLNQRVELLSKLVLALPDVIDGLPVIKQFSPVTLSSYLKKARMQAHVSPKPEQPSPVTAAEISPKIDAVVSVPNEEKRYRHSYADLVEMFELNKPLGIKSCSQEKFDQELDTLCESGLPEKFVVILFDRLEKRFRDWQALVADSKKITPTFEVKDWSAGPQLGIFAVKSKRDDECINTAATVRVIARHLEQIKPGYNFCTDSSLDRFIARETGLAVEQYTVRDRALKKIAAARYYARTNGGLSNFEAVDNLLPRVNDEEKEAAE